MTDRHKPNMPGGYYLSPGNQELEPISFRLTPARINRFKRVAAAGLSQREAAALAFELLEREIRTPKTPSRSENLPPAPNTRQIAASYKGDNDVQEFLGPRPATTARAAGNQSKLTH
jgi:hypothetical protein